MYVHWLSTSALLNACTLTAFDTSGVLENPGSESWTLLLPKSVTRQMYVPAPTNTLRLTQQMIVKLSCVSRGPVHDKAAAVEVLKSTDPPYCPRSSIQTICGLSGW